MFRAFKVYGILILLVTCSPASGRMDRRNIYARMLSGFPNLKCNFESSCAWKWSNDSFSNVSAAETKAKLAPKMYQAPDTDADHNENGHFLFVFDTNARKRELNITSTTIDPIYFDKNTDKICTLTFSLNANTMPLLGNISILIKEENMTKVIAKHVSSEVFGEWQTKRINLGHPEEKFVIIIEIGATIQNVPSYVAIDNIELEHCFPDVSRGDCPDDRKFRCIKDEVCIPLNMVCDIKRDCTDSADEKQNCDKVPAGTRCTFENGWCGWRNTTDKHHTLKWKLNRGSTKNKHTGPSNDNTFANETGTYAYVDMSTGTLGSLALMESVPINPPPPVHGDPSSSHHNSCYVSFFYHKYGPHSGSLGLYLREEKLDSPRNNYRLWWSYGNRGDMWLRQVVILPNITERYTIQFEARKSMSSRGDVAIDDISFSPRCFGIGIPEKDLNGYDYWEYPKKNSEIMHQDFTRSPIFTFTTCGALGSEGPTAEQCDDAYNGTSTKVNILGTENMAGFQRWIVPETSYYTIIAKGARGGKGADALGESRAAVLRMVTELYRGQSIYMLIGQEGQDACRKLSFDTPSCLVNLHFRTTANFKNYLRGTKISDGGGGGGGATYLFTWEKRYKEPEPLLVAAGGGGLAHGPFVDTGKQHGNGLNASLPNITAPSLGPYPAGSGGGWKPSNFSNNNLTGRALLEGGKGGLPCYYIMDKMKGVGGFGGGGGGCVAGGGGGGSTGGRAWSESHQNGEGGWSWVGETAQYREVKAGIHYGPGNVVVIPAVSGCNCEYRCVALDEARTSVKCVCPPGWNLAQDSRSCVLLNSPSFGSGPLWIILSCLCSLTILLITVSILLYNRYLQQKSELTQRKVCGAGVQLNHLNAAPTSVRLTEFNPNYEFGGVTYTIRDLKEIPREKVQLVKPLGCGAFGDVYQGLLRNRDTDSVDLAVAVKILPALSSDQAEADFLTEALIMAKFNHPNIVHFIGACFDTHPRYIILELLAGGDLKNFLRENRPKVDKPTTLTMKDLLQCAIDVAKGCQYLEELHFTHRDIAARNCLLTSRGPGRTVKIADFGMSRDIYRSDYYKKGGKAMLPIKWMPPEAFLDGIFSSKTDVWSFGVLLWEVMSLGFMPYTGIRNREVMMFVARGARLGPPANCPPPVYAIMLMCWDHEPAERPNFATVIERLGYCIQDPAVINTQLPVYKGPLPSEIDKTLMRQTNLDADYTANDYMVPIKPDTPVDWKNGITDNNKYAVEEIPSIKLPLEEVPNVPPHNRAHIVGEIKKDDGRFPSREPIEGKHFGTRSDQNDGKHFNRSDQSDGQLFTVSGQYVKDTQVI